MFRRLFGREGPETATAAALYGAIVTQARSPALYAGMGVPDTVAGRFEMVVLHLVLLLEALEAGGEEAQGVGQAVFDHFCTDMDRSLRELGIGDLGVPRRMRQIGEAFYGRAAAYSAAIAGRSLPGLADALERNILPHEPAAAEALARYTLAARDALAAAAPAALLAAALPFPQAAAFAAAAAAP
jgi:cytochrome b pre-mRNA-processing protein 3